MLTAPARLLLGLTRWHVHSQQTARRNALVACTALAGQRRELDEVEEFLASHAAARARVTTLEVRVRQA
jgi:hypothetical protein